MIVKRAAGECYQSRDSATPCYNASRRRQKRPEMVSRSEHQYRDGEKQMQPHEETSLAPPSWRRPRLAEYRDVQTYILAAVSGPTLSNQEVVNLLVLATYLARA
jgi:hypothetical protein